MFKDNYSITLLGDSISKGVIYDDEKNRYVILKDSFCSIIEKRLSGVVHNAGKFGSTIIKGSKRLYDVLTKETPDIVLIEFGGNDCDFNWEEIALKPFDSHEPNTPLTLFENTLRNIISSLKDKNVIPVLMTLPPLDAEKYFKWVSKNREDNARNILTWLGNVRNIYTWHETYNSIILKLSKETQTKLIDIRSEFLSSISYTEYLCKDGIHPNEKGHALIANKIMDYLEKNYSFLIKQ